MECNDLPEDIFEEINIKDTNKVKTKDHNKVRRKLKDKTNKRIRNEDETEEMEDDEMDNIAVYLHEDVADFSLGDGSGEIEDVDFEIGSVPEDIGLADADSEPPELPDVDPEPAELVAASDGDDSDDEYDPEPRPVRKSVRFSKPPRLFSYDEIGGPPVLIDIKKKR